ncbi:MAG: aldo/keto reductase [Anaerolineae bacterium]|nr:aldo/keto reductase [Anaerolineae bacterium]
MEHNESQKPLGRSSLNVPRLGVGAMTWGDAKGLARLHPAKIAYGGAHGRDEEMRALEASLAAGVTLFDTAAMYSGGASELRLGELARGTQALIATKFPPGIGSKTEDMPKALDASLARLGRSSLDLYQHHFPSNRVSIPMLMNLMADALEAGKVKAIGVSNSGGNADRAAGAASLASNRSVFAVASTTRDEWRARCLSRAGDHPDRLSAPGQWRAHRQICRGRQTQGAAALHGELSRKGSPGHRSGGGVAAGNR